MKQVIHLLLLFLCCLLDAVTCNSTEVLMTNEKESPKNSTSLTTPPHFERIDAVTGINRDTSTAFSTTNTVQTVPNKVNQTLNLPKSKTAILRYNTTDVTTLYTQTDRGNNEYKDSATKKDIETTWKKTTYYGPVTFGKEVKYSGCFKIDVRDMDYTLQIKEKYKLKKCFQLCTTTLIGMKKQNNKTVMCFCFKNENELAEEAKAKRCNKRCAIEENHPCGGKKKRLISVFQLIAPHLQTGDESPPESISADVHLGIGVAVSVVFICSLAVGIFVFIRWTRRNTKRVNNYPDEASDTYASVNYNEMATSCSIEGSSNVLILNRTYCSRNNQMQGSGDASHQRSSIPKTRVRSIPEVDERQYHHLQLRIDHLETDRDYLTPLDLDKPPSYIDVIENDSNYFHRKGSDGIPFLPRESNPENRISGNYYLVEKHSSCSAPKPIFSSSEGCISPRENNSVSSPEVENKSIAREGHEYKNVRSVNTFFPNLSASLQIPENKSMDSTCTDAISQNEQQLQSLQNISTQSKSSDYYIVEKIQSNNIASTSNKHKYDKNIEEDDKKVDFTIDNFEHNVEKKHYENGIQLKYCPETENNVPEESKHVVFLNEMEGQTVIKKDNATIKYNSDPVHNNASSLPDCQMEYALSSETKVEEESGHNSVPSSVLQISMQTWDNTTSVLNSYGDTYESGNDNNQLLSVTQDIKNSEHLK